MKTKWTATLETAFSTAAAAAVAVAGRWDKSCYGF